MNKKKMCIQQRKQQTIEKGQNEESLGRGTAVVNRAENVEITET